MLLTWLIRILKWGGLALALVNGLVFLVIGPLGMAPADDQVEMGAPGDYLFLARFGVFAFFIAWAIDSWSRATGGD